MHGQRTVRDEEGIVSRGGHAAFGMEDPGAAQEQGLHLTVVSVLSGRAMLGVVRFGVELVEEREMGISH